MPACRALSTNGLHTFLEDSAELFSARLQGGFQIGSCQVANDQLLDHDLTQAPPSLMAEELTLLRKKSMFGL